MRGSALKSGSMLLCDDGGNTGLVARDALPRTTYRLHLILLQRHANRYIVGLITQNSPTPTSCAVGPQRADVEVECWLLSRRGQGSQVVPTATATMSARRSSNCRQDTFPLRML